MPKQIWIINGGNVSNTYEEYLEYLKAKTVSLDKLRLKDWKATLGQKLGAGYDVLIPKMPCQQNAKYAEWKIYFEKLITVMDEEVILVGHSLGGIFLAKYLSEETFPKKIRATILVAPPFNTVREHPIADFILSDDLNMFAKQGGKMFIYHSKDDQIVPYSNFEEYKKALPTAHALAFDGKGHFDVEDFSEIVSTILQLE